MTSPRCARRALSWSKAFSLSVTRPDPLLPPRSMLRFVSSSFLFSPAFISITSMLPAVAGDTIKEEEHCLWSKAQRSRLALIQRFSPSHHGRLHKEESQPTALPRLPPSISRLPTPMSASPCPAPGPTPGQSYADLEEPGSCDRYGFHKQSQSITCEQYDDWNKSYSQYLERRRRKWIAYLEDNALRTDRPIRFPPPNAKTRRFVCKCIPPDWRGAAWFYYAGGPAILSKHSGHYEKLLTAQAVQIDMDAIERDLHRTFPIIFNSSPPQLSLTSPPP